MLTSTMRTYPHYAYFHNEDISALCLLPQWVFFLSMFASTMRTFPHYAYFHNGYFSLVCLLPQWGHFHIMLTSAMRIFPHYACFHNEDISTMWFMWIISLSQTDPHCISTACFASTFLIVYISICFASTMCIVHNLIFMFVETLWS